MQQWPEKRRFNLGIDQSINQSIALYGLSLSLLSL